MFNRLESIKQKYEELTKQLSDPEVLSDFNQVKKLSKEQSDLEQVVNVYKNYNKNKDKALTLKEELQIYKKQIEWAIKPILEQKNNILLNRIHCMAKFSSANLILPLIISIKKYRGNCRE